MHSFDEFLHEQQLLEKLMIFGKSAYPKFGNIVILAGGAGCFESSTKVKTRDGLKDISDIKIGDEVLTINEDTQEFEYKKVLDNLQHYAQQKELVRVTLEDGSSFVCSDDHEFYIDSKWVKAKDLI